MLMMLIMKSKSLRECYSRCRKAGRVLKYVTWDHVFSRDIKWFCLHSKEDIYNIPKDVPKGHLVVYVGEECRRFVIKVTLLNHPLFQALLDQAEEVFQFATNSPKLCIPCSEYMFLSVLQCISSEVIDLRCSFSMRRLFFKGNISLHPYKSAFCLYIV
ncbi:hypothetical protein ACLB2K_076403 [Fragaria x ananassa]